MRVIVPLILCAVLAACSSAPTQEQQPAGVEDRKPSAITPAPAPDLRPSDAKPIPSVDLTTRKPAGSPLTDPSSILSKRSIYYDFDKYDVKDEFRPMIEAHAKFLRENRDMKILIQGNTDERGGREYNIALGQRRADGVKRTLILLGAQEDQVEAVSLGEEKPKAEGTSEEAYAQNRRSDILYKGEF